MRLRPMTHDEFAAYRESAVRDYADQVVESGTLPEEGALEKARVDYERLLPEGLDTPGHLLWTVLDADRPVGILWLETGERSDGRSAYVYDIAVREDCRRRGYGRAIMLAAEDACRERGAVSLRLNVFGHNHAARSLYEQLGFETTSVQMRKRLA